MKENKVYLLHILEGIGKIDRYLEGYDFSKFEKDEKTIDATIKALEIIGGQLITLVRILRAVILNYHLVRP